jgi:hypothetical protein
VSVNLPHKLYDNSHVFHFLFKFYFKLRFSTSCKYSSIEILLQANCSQISSLTIKNDFSIIRTTSVISEKINLASCLICANEVKITSGKEKSYSQVVY